MVEAGVEDLSLVGCAAFDGDLVEKLRPCAACVGADFVEIPAGDFFVEIRESVGFADVGDADFELNLAVIAEVEPCAGVFAGGFALVFLDRVAVPGGEVWKGCSNFAAK